LSSILICFSEAYPLQRSKASARASAPFLKQAKAYEATSNTTKLVLKNGLTVLLNEYHSQPVVSFQMYIKSGTSDEPAQSEGIARLLEAVVRRGVSENKPEGILKDIRAYGGIFRSATDYTNTIYEVVAPSSQWKKILKIQAAALISPTLNDVELKHGITAVLNQKRRLEDDFQSSGAEKLLELGFSRPSMKTGISEESLQKLSWKDLSIFHNAAYVPSKMLLAISGDIITSEVLNELVGVYSQPAGAHPRSDTAAFGISQREFRYLELRDNIPVPQLFFGFHTASINSEDYAATEILSAILGLGDGSVLSDRLRDRKQVIWSGVTDLTSNEEFGYMTVRLEVAPEKIDQSEIAALTEIEILKEKGPIKADLERAVAQLERKYWMDLETVTGRAQALARYELSGDWKKMNSYVSRLRQVKQEDVKRVANKYLRLDECSLLEYLPLSLEPRNLNTESSRRTLEGLLAPSLAQELEEREKETVWALEIPPSTDKFKYSEIRQPVQIASILRGPDIYIREDHTLPLIQVGIFFPGGKLVETKENSGITRLMLHMMLQGVKSKKTEQFYRQLELYGGKVQPIVEDDYFGFLFSILSRNVDPGLNLLGEAIKSPKFEKERINRQKQLQALEITGRKSSDVYARQLANKMLFNDSSYALDSSGTDSSLSAITTEALQSWYEIHVRNRKPLVAIIGDTSGSSMAPFFVKNFSSTRYQEFKMAGDFIKPLQKKELHEENWNRKQSLVSISFQAPAINDEDRLPLTVLQYFTGEGGRYFQNLEVKGILSDSVFLRYEPKGHSGSITVTAAADPESDKEALNLFRNEISGMTSNPILYGDLQSAINSAVGNFWIHNQEFSAQIISILENVLAGKRIEEYQNYPTQLQEVNEEDLADAAKRILNVEKAISLCLHGLVSVDSGKQQR
jgi:zinc protease